MTQATPLQSTNLAGHAPIALITGITGQDGGYLAAFLLEKGYAVHGVSRDVSRLDRGRFAHIADLNRRLHLHSCDMIDAAGLSRLLDVVRPDDIYNLAAQTHIQTSFDDPAYTTDVNATGAVRLLNALVKLDPARRTRFYQASSSEMFGDAKGKTQNEDTALHPLSPYAVSKHAAFEATVNFREAFGVHASNGILFNHESPWRGRNFVTRKISHAVAEWHAGNRAPLKLGNLDARRDWGHARDYVEGMWLMLQQDEPGDYVLATGEHHSVREFVELAFSEIGRSVVWEGEGLDETGFDADTGERLVAIDPAFFRPTDISVTIGDASRAQRKLGWRRRTSFAELVGEMVAADIARLAQASVAVAAGGSD
ncbi:MAG: GDP-mannose 4,6-dehydratase [Alphaproteobacteria bacterium HGW-Alphaproteobacteria-11]|nr:MAG: GDP-mannose 4,6-dehydratase [Alphaproteobacteria bacterium HGW-Alphaproteobacteria-11]